MKTQILTSEKLKWAVSLFLATILSLFSTMANAQKSNGDVYNEYGNSMLGIADLQVEYPDMVFEYNYDHDGNVESVTIKGIDNLKDKDYLERELIKIHDLRDDLLYTRDENGVYYRAEDRPRYQGGKLALKRAVQTEIKYPENAQQQGIQGVIMLKFVVDRNGNVSNLKAFDKIEETDWIVDEMENAALDGFHRIEPNWIPGEIDGMAVPTWVMVPVRFDVKAPIGLQLLM